MEEFGIDPGHAVAERDANRKTEHGCDSGKHESELHVMPADRLATHTERLDDADLRPLQLDDPQHRCVQQQDGDAYEDGWDQDTDGRQFLELARDEGMRVLPGAIMDIGGAIGGQQPLQRFGRGSDRCTRIEPDGKVVEPVCHAEVRRQRRTRHPDDGEAMVVGNDLSRPEGIDVFGRKGDTDNRKDALASADRHGQPTAGNKTMRRGKTFIDHDLPGMTGRRLPPPAQREGVDRRITLLRQRYQPTGDRLVEAIDRNRALADDPRRNRRHAGNSTNGLGQRQGRGRQ